MWDVWFLGQIVYSKIEHPWIINKIILSFQFKFNQANIFCLPLVGYEQRLLQSLCLRNLQCKIQLHYTQGDLTLIFPTFSNPILKVKGHLFSQWQIDGLLRYMAPKQFSETTILL